MLKKTVEKFAYINYMNPIALCRNRNVSFGMRSKYFIRGVVQHERLAKRSLHRRPFRKSFELEEKKITIGADGPADSDTVTRRFVSISSILPGYVPPAFI